MKKLYSTIIVMTALVLSANAQSDFDIAQSFMSKKGVKLVDNSLTRGVSVDKPYNIYKGEQGKGFAIVINGAIVGYSTENECGEVPPQLEEMLESYARYTNGSGGSSKYPSWFTPRNVKPIEPLIKTKWGQWDRPFKRKLEGISGICGVVAHAQILHYYRIPCTVKPICRLGVVLEPTTFDHSKMIDDYLYSQYTEEQGEEVAKLYEYIYYSDLGEEAFNIQKRFYSLEYSGNVTYETLDSCLEKARPLGGMGARADNACHWYVIDGRDSDGLYHVNFGWGGSSDGYYVFLDDQEKHHKMLKKDDSGVLCEFYACIVSDLILNDPPTSVDEIRWKRNVNDEIYNLQGQRVINPKNGIYIVNGKKVLIK